LPRGGVFVRGLTSRRSARLPRTSALQSQSGPPAGSLLDWLQERLSRAARATRLSCSLLLPLFLVWQ